MPELSNKTCLQSTHVFPVVAFLPFGLCFDRQQEKAGFEFHAEIARHSFGNQNRRTTNCLIESG